MVAGFAIARAQWRVGEGGRVRGVAWGEGEARQRTEKLVARATRQRARGREGRSGEAGREKASFQSVGLAIGRMVSSRCFFLSQRANDGDEAG